MARGLTDVAGEAIVLAGAARALLLEVADPAVAQGVAEHSDFSHAPMARLDGTLTYVYAVVFGDDADRAFVRRLVGRAHAPVHGTMPAADPTHNAAVNEVTSGRTTHATYSASDPVLQLWVAATLYDTTRVVWERIFGPLDAESADRVYREFAIVGTTLQMPATLWPATREAFDAYWHERVAALQVSAEARHIARDLLHPPVAPWWLRALSPQVRLVTAGLLPPRLARAYGLVLSPKGEARFEAWMHRARRIYPRLPMRLRLSARDHYLRRLRALRAKDAGA